MVILKYVIKTNKIPVIFNSEIFHNEVLFKPISAGYLILIFDKGSSLFCAKCFGESTTLNIGVQEEDASIIENFLNNQFCKI